MNVDLEAGDKVFINSKALLDILEFQTNNEKEKKMPPLEEILQSLKNPFTIKSVKNVGSLRFYIIEIFKGGEYFFDYSELLKVEEGL